MSAQQYYQQQPVAGYPQQPAQTYGNQPPQMGNGYNNAYPQQPSYNQNQYAPPPNAPPPQPNYGMKPSAPYAATPNNAEFQPQEVPDQAPFSQQTEKTGPRMAPKARLNDPIFLVLYIASVAGFAVLSGIAIKSFVSVNGLGGGVGNAVQGGTGTAVTLDYHTVYLLLLACGVGLLIASLWLGLVRAATKIIIEITLALTVLLNIAICIYYFYIKYWSGAIIFLVIALLSVFFYWTMRKRIPLAKILIQTTIDISKHHKSVYVVAIIALIIEAAWSVWYSFTCIAIYVKWTPGSAACSGDCSSGKVAGLIFYATFSYYWSSQVITNIALCTMAGGVFGGWYYFGPRSANGGVPKRATLKAFTRSITFNLGSIAFGSLIVTILELLRLVLNSISQYEGGQGDMVGAVIACCAACCVSIIAGLIEWFNKYAYIEISLYGKAYIPAAKDTWRLMKDRGIDALINDSLVGTVIMWGAYVNGFLCALFGYLYLRFTNPAYNSDGQYSAPIILFCFLIGINMGLTLGSVIDAGVSTIFVGLGEDPMILAERSPALFEIIRQAYPRVIEGIPPRRP